jgi:hypothetical protein
MSLSTRFTPSTASAQAKSRRRQGKRARLTQLRDMQDVLFADAMNPEATPKDRATSACAWDKLEERIRILSMKPLPGSLKPESPKAKRRVASVVEPTELP